MITFSRGSTQKVKLARSPVQARNAKVYTTEIMAVVGFFPRYGFPKIELSGGKLITNNVSTFAPDMYRVCTIDAAWDNGDTAQLVCTVDDFFGDVTTTTTYSWTSGSTVTNGLFRDLSANASCGGLTLSYRTTDPTSTPTSTSITSDTSATATWVTGGVTKLTITITLSSPQSYDDAVQRCTGLLQWATLLDEFYYPDKTYNCTISTAGSSTTADLKLRWTSYYRMIAAADSWGNKYTNAVCVKPVRGGTNNVGLYANGWRYGYDITTNTMSDAYPTIQGMYYYRQYAPGVNEFYGSLIRMMCAYGMNNSQFGGAPTLTGINAISSVKTAVRAVTVMSGAVKNMVTLTTGANTEGAFTPPHITNIPGLYIFDPVPLMASPPYGYQADPSGGGLNLESLSPIDASNYGAAYWDYTAYYTPHPSAIPSPSAIPQA